MSPVSRRPGLVLLAGLVPFAAACHTWHVPSLAAETLLAAPSRPSIARFTLRDSTRVVLRQPRLLGDSVTGMPSESQRGTMRTLPLADIGDISRCAASRPARRSGWWLPASPGCTRSPSSAARSRIAPASTLEAPPPCGKDGGMLHAAPVGYL